MKKALFMIAAAMFIFAGCQKEQGIKELYSNDVIRINVEQIAPTTKVVAVDIDANPLAFEWEEGDEVAFKDTQSGNITKFACTDPTTGTFAKTEGTGLDPELEYDVVYPAIKFENEQETYSETYRENQIPKEHVIKVSQPVSGSSTEFTLDKHSTIIHFQLNGDSVVGSIEYQTYDGENYNQSTILSCEEGIQLSETATHFYIDALETSAEGFKLVFKDASGEMLGEKASSFDLSTADGKVVDFDAPLADNGAISTDIASLLNVKEGSLVSLSHLAVLASGKSSAVLSDGEYHIYVTGQTMPVGNEVKVTGTVTFDESNIPTIAATSFEITSETTTITAPSYSYINETGYVERTLFSGVLQKVEDQYIIVNFMEDVNIIQDPKDELDLDGQVGSYIAVKGYCVNVETVEDNPNKNHILVESLTAITIAPAADWTLSYQYVEGNEYPELITNTVATPTDRYMLSFVSVVDAAAAGLDTPEAVAKYLIDENSDLLQWALYYKYSTYSPELVLSSYTHAGSDSESFDEVDYGEYYLVATGIDEEGLPTGKYAAQKIEKKYPYEKAEYAEYLGTWFVGGKTVVVSENVNGQSYKIDGLAATTLGGADVTLNAVYNSELGYMAIPEQNIGSNTHPSYGACSEEFSGLFTQGSKVYVAYPQNTAEPTIAVNAYKNPNGSFVWKGGRCPYGKFSSIGASWTILTGQNAGAGNKNAIMSLPQDFVKAPNRAEYADFLGRWIVNGKTVVVSEKSQGNTYNVSGLVTTPLGGLNVTVEGAYDSTLGNMTITEQKIGEYNHSNYGVCFEYLSGFFTQSATTYAAYPFNTAAPAVVVTAWINEDGNAAWQPGSCQYGGFVALGTCWVIQEGENAGKGNSSPSISLPQNVQKAPEMEAGYAKWLGTWSTATGRSITISEGITNETFIGIWDSNLAGAEIEIPYSKGKIAFNAQIVGAGTSKYGPIYNLFAGCYWYEDVSTPADSGWEMMPGEYIISESELADGDKSFTISQGTYEDPDGDVTLGAVTYGAYIYDGEYAGYTISYSDVTPIELPATFTKVEPVSVSKKATVSSTKATLGRKAAARSCKFGAGFPYNGTRCTIGAQQLPVFQIDLNSFANISRKDLKTERRKFNK